MRIWIALIALLFVAACGRPPMDPAADKAARDFYAAVQSGDWQGVERALSPSLARSPNLRDGFDRLRRGLPHETPREARAVGWQELDKGVVSAVHLYRFQDSDVVVRTLLQPQPDGGPRVASFMANRLPRGQVEANRFTLSGKTPQHYAFLVSAFLSPLVMVAVAAMAAMTRGLRFKIAWMVLALVGVGQAWFNWTTGAGGFNWAEISLVNVGFGRDTDISPWLIRFSMPVGALVVLARLVLLPGKKEDKEAAA